WQHHFGTGLVATPNDFGAQGAKPAHPELLDWLAGELIHGGWRLKPIHPVIMCSAVYQQSSAGRRGLDGKSANHDMALTNSANAASSTVACFFPKPHRLEAEAIRDSLLFVSGVLDTSMFGPGTLDPASRRRSIYFTVKRSRMIAALQAFDAPEPLVSQGARPTTTVAPQALWLMNSSHVRAWAGAFAKRFCPVPDLPLAPAVAR